MQERRKKKKKKKKATKKKKKFGKGKGDPGTGRDAPMTVHYILNMLKVKSMHM